MMRLHKVKKIGLALGGGSVLGAAHVGVLKAIKETGLEIGWIAGTSIGGLVSSFLAFGKGYEEVKDIAINLSWKDIAGFSFSKYGLLSNRKMKKLLESTIGDVTFEEANIPLAIVATNISNGEKIVLRKGKVADAVMATTCIPGIFQAVEIEGNLLVDGGIVENVPVSPLKEMGAKFIIAVDLHSNYRYKRPENIIDVLLNSFRLTLATASKIQAAEADILIKPDLSSFNLVDTDQTEKLIEAGYKETLSELQKKLKK